MFVFSPNGDLYALTRGSSVLDFGALIVSASVLHSCIYLNFRHFTSFLAFKVHSHLGSHCVGAKVNGKQVTLRHLIQNGDTVEILTHNNQSPKREWLKYVRTSKAKSRIRSYLKQRERMHAIATGKRMIEQGMQKYSPDAGDAGKRDFQRKMSHLLTTFNSKDENALLAALGYGQISLESVMIAVFGFAVVKTNGNQNKREKDDSFILKSKGAIIADATRHQSSQNGIVVGQERNILLKFCKSCTPLMGEEIRGVVSQGNGVKVHRVGCQYLAETANERIVDVQWDKDMSNIRLRPVKLQVLCEDSPGVLANMSRTITSRGLNIGNVTLRKLRNGRGLARLEVMMGKVGELEDVMTSLKMEKGILSVSRR